MKKIIIILTATAMFIGCAVGPDYKRPKVAMPDAHRADMTVTEKKAVADLPWWDIFKDPVLKNLIDEALKNNMDLKMATARVAQMRSLTGVANGDFFPQINYSAIGNRGKNVPADGLTSNTTGNMAMGNLGFQWELDVWGRVRRASESAGAQYLASVEARRDIMILLIAEVANAYFELRELDNELEIAKRTEDSFQDTYNLFMRRYKGGEASLLESSRAGAALAQTSAAIPYLESQIFAKENEVNFLLGKGPASIQRGQALSNQYLTPIIPSGVPSSLLERRPDIREAEANLIAANADIGVAKAAFFPQFSLTGLLGASSPDLKTFSHSWALGGGVTGPIFNGGKIWSNYNATKHVYEQVKTQYEKTVINALREVSDTLTLQQKLVGVRDQQAKAVEFLRKATRLSIARYSGGLARYTEVLDAQQQLFPAENNLAQTDRDRLLAMVQLFKALGGGWEIIEQPIQVKQPIQAKQLKK
ncbi:MAG: efflux transporter outer membrane subunit [Proteobacteria bacterium]|nr:efflux transporter outer membrane subunit [Pseudomonadota bacterium]